MALHTTGWSYLDVRLAFPLETAAALLKDQDQYPVSVCYATA
jgi:hypothetical protein